MYFYTNKGHSKITVLVDILEGNENGMDFFNLKIDTLDCIIMFAIKMIWYKFFAIENKNVWL